MKRIAIDMDEVIADFIPKHLALFNRDYNENISIEDLKGKKLRDLRPHLQDEVTNYLLDPSFFRDLAVMKDSQDVIKELSQYYEIVWNYNNSSLNDIKKKGLISFLR
ncbi:hypothetical protein G4D61_02195 [Bacillus ginsengihumi]|uniref:Uncharacterized protein n=1 Tax=Heyndrickxia ginsengihumi TaxID=363870 RepID=A0A6M0P2U9_9BACI|nr:hypothetical protein [Heyndrickxia ginsengihumi]MBE6184047.1 hypothetical protein [Bacillus sp. (in: firmicutes)]MCM3024568.1 hypothetical protein [Heyndrickxia ginsengihumi]NEY18777.1 hypothetical protein [Heyndrickxia ginsengihumi]